MSIEPVGCAFVKEQVDKPGQLAWRPICTNPNVVTVLGLRPIDACTAGFGLRVWISPHDGRDQTLVIAGADAADPARGYPACSSPLARATRSKSGGDAVGFAVSELGSLALEPIGPEG